MFPEAPKSDASSIGHQTGPTVPLFRLPSTPLPAASTYLGPYQLIRRIGRGGLGDVFAARHALTGELVALKRLRDGEAATPAERRSFLREVEVARRVAHPGLVPVLDAGDCDGQLFFTMPLVTGGSLEHRLRAGLIGLRQGVAILAKVARAVHFAHDQGVLHRDLKPANILLSDAGEPLVADFGLARLVGPHTAHTITGVVMGSVPYMAPEQAAGLSHRATRATDVWPLGVILYELLAGRRPFVGNSPTEVLSRIRHDVPTLPRRLRDGVPPELEAVCLRCLRKPPQARYATLAELADELEGWLQGRPIRTALDATCVAAGGRARRWAGATAALALLCAVFSFGLLAAPQAAPAPEVPPAEQVRRAFHRARPGQPLVLYREGVRPAWFAVPVGADDALVKFPPGRALSVETRWACLLELLPPDPKRGAYRLTAVLRQTDSVRLPRVGPYAGREHHPAPAPAGAHTFALLSYADPALLRALGQPARPLVAGQGHRAELVLGWVSPQGPRPPHRAMLRAGPNLPLAEVALDARGRTAWRELVIEVRPGSVRVLLDGVAGGAEQARLTSLFCTAAVTDPRKKNVQPAYAPAGGAGLVVLAGAIEVRRVLVEPLPPAP